MTRKSRPYPSKRRAELGIIKVLLLTPHPSKYNLANFSRGLLYSGREGGGWSKHIKIKSANLCFTHLTPVAITELCFQEKYSH